MLRKQDWMQLDSKVTYYQQNMFNISLETINYIYVHFDQYRLTLILDKLTFYLSLIFRTRNYIDRNGYLTTHFKLSYNVYTNCLTMFVQTYTRTSSSRLDTCSILGVIIFVAKFIINVFEIMCLYQVVINIVTSQLRKKL